jgi:hypothetical protein
MSTTKFGAENPVRSLGRIRLGLKRPEARQVPPMPVMLCHPAAAQLQSWLEPIFAKLIH